ncbi:MAG TPA: sugar phosphate isomerase/epimerase family protein [Tepidisphaeraceae bacterium]|jgi:sugar phosphate isomerase/epimerase|nr:sugar phosphate isomerase/epimerase family protein [Tepidisphaeraceae bacterium]
MKSAVTVSLVAEAKGGPFVFWDDLPAACRKAKGIGFDAVEIFPPEPAAIEVGELRQLLSENKLSLAAVGTGAGWVKHKLLLTDANAQQRKKAKEFVRGMIDFAGKFGAPTIIGSMQGRWGGDVTREKGLEQLAEAVGELGEYAKQYRVPLLFEPLNRYESNFVSTVEGGLDLLKRAGNDNVRLLCDLFHMNIEEQDIAASLRRAGKNLGHVHLADSNRRAAGGGHTDFVPIAKALREIGYDRFVSAEAMAGPGGPEEAAKMTMAAFRKYFA